MVKVILNIKIVAFLQYASYWNKLHDSNILTLQLQWWTLTKVIE